MRYAPRIQVAVLVLASAACGSNSSPLASSNPPVAGPDQALVSDAMQYWADVLGLAVVSTSSNALPRILIRSGTDGLGSSASARALIDGTDLGNQALSALIVIRPGVVNRRVYRHEMGHALGFLSHSETGLMAPGGGEALSDRERAMMVALYSLPPGTRVEADGSWEGPNGQSGVLSNEQAARDIIEFNVNADSGSPFRRQDVTCRWMAPVNVYVQR